MFDFLFISQLAAPKTGTVKLAHFAINITVFVNRTKAKVSLVEVIVNAMLV